MHWKEIRTRYPHQWLLVEAIKAHSESGQRILEELTVINVFPDARMALKAYMAFHRQSPQREFLVLHTDKETLQITEQRWLGVRGGDSSFEN
jgi:hypothetical protein